MSKSDANYDYCLLDHNLMTPVYYEAPAYISVSIVDFIAVVVGVAFFVLIIINLKKVE